jgi:hypothetical protein
MWQAANTWQLNHQFNNIHCRTLTVDLNRVPFVPYTAPREGAFMVGAAIGKAAVRKASDYFCRALGAAIGKGAVRKAAIRSFSLISFDHGQS